MAFRLMLAWLALCACLASFAASAASVHYRWLEVDGMKIFYREAGDPAKPAILLLHGFPSSSQMYETLMERLADRFHLVAPDYPGSGHTVLTETARFTPTFEGLTDAMERFAQKKGLQRFALYVQDFGGPVGFRLAARQPGRIAGLIVQNANAYEEGLAPMLVGNIRHFSAGVTPETLPALEKVLSAKSVYAMYTTGMRNPEALNPDSWALAERGLVPPAHRRIQMHLLADYHTNVAAYGAWQAYFRKHQPPTLVVWGKNDPFFLEAGAHAFRRDLPRAQVHVLNTGHFALEEDDAAIAQLIAAFFNATR
jgi:pimeloyl-ACP methyl ester carboxylesterase